MGLIFAHCLEDLIDSLGLKKWSTDSLHLSCFHISTMWKQKVADHDLPYDFYTLQGIGQFQNFGDGYSFDDSKIHSMHPQKNTVE